LYRHQVDVGHMAEIGIGAGYLGHLNQQYVTIAEVLGQAGVSRLRSASGISVWKRARTGWSLLRALTDHHGRLAGFLRWHPPHPFTPEEETD
jgi:hypothetical protein